MGRFIFRLVMAAMFLAWAGPATAQQQIPQVAIPCILLPPGGAEQIRQRASESVIFSGGVETNEGAWYLIVQHNPNTGQSTVILGLPNGHSCAVFAGEGVMIPYNAPEQGS